MASVRISEIHYHPSSLDSDDEFLELHNPTEDAIDLSDWRITGGIEARLVPGTILPPLGYAILSPDPKRWVDQPATTVIGTYSGKLSNKGERVSLVNHMGDLIDSVAYLTEEGWPGLPDGHGPSLERIHPAMPASAHQSWATGPIGGSPGLVNASRIERPLPVVTNVSQSPASPSSIEPVLIQASVLSDTPADFVQLNYQSESEDIVGSVAMSLVNEAASVNTSERRYVAIIPSAPNGTLIEFWIEAYSATGGVGRFPFPVQSPPAIYRVDDQVYETGFPLYKIIMRDADEFLLRTRGIRSNDELPASFVFNDTIIHGVGVRFRGKGSRGIEPKSYRVNFTPSKRFGSIRKLNLNAYNIDRQFIGMQCFLEVGLPAPQSRFVSLAFNQSYVPNYLQVERTDLDMLERYFSNPEGNLYRGVEQANLDYRGEDKEFYRPHYVKETSTLRDDFTDLIRLCEAMTATSDAEFEAAVRERIDVDQWIRWFALKQVLNDLEGGLSKERGDDYFIYREENETQFTLLPWDLDSVIAEPYLPPHHHGTFAIQRLLRHPAFANQYYREIAALLETTLTPERMDTIIDRAAPAFPAEHLQFLKDAYRRLHIANTANVPRDLTVRVHVDENIPETLVAENTEWRFWRGLTQPPGDRGAWIRPDYDDSTWETGIGGFGFGDGDDRTVLDDMQDTYTTVIIRQTFYIDDPAIYSNFGLTANYDDGFIAYLNGVEIASRNVLGNPRYNHRATRSNEAGTPETFILESATSIIQLGTNVLAIMGLNSSISSTDFSLAVNLLAQRPDPTRMRISGAVDSTETLAVRINGAYIPFAAWRATWETIVPLHRGTNKILIEAIGEHEAVVDSHVALIDGPPLPYDEIQSATTWTIDDSPVQLNRPLLIRENGSLTIEAGVNVLAASGAYIISHGGFDILGTPDAPVAMSPQRAAEPWAGLILQSEQASTLSGLQLSNASSARHEGSTYIGALTILDSTVTLSQCVLADLPGVGVEARAANLVIEDSRFQRMGEAIHATLSKVHIVRNHIEDIRGYSDAIDLDGQSGLCIIANNTIIGSEDDGIDLGFCTARIEANWIEGCTDKAISMEGSSAPQVINCIIVGCESGVVSKDQCMALVSHTTIDSCTRAIRVYQKNTGAGGAHLDAINTVITNAHTAVTVDELSTLLEEALVVHPRGETSLFDSTSDIRFLPVRNSPLHDAGVPSTVRTDIYGNARPSGNDPDIGAVERSDETGIHDWHQWEYIYPEQQRFTVPVNPVLNPR